MKQGLFDLSGRRAFITGSSGGIGLALATGLGQAGAQVVLNGRRADVLDEAVASLRNMGIDAQGERFDVTDESAVQAGVAAIESTHGPIDILVNNAGMQHRTPLAEFETADWRRLMRTNLESVFLVTRAVVQGMLQRKAGKIINICSVQSELARPGIAPYAASKGALKMLTQNMCAEWAPHNIQCNGIGPGYFETELNAALVNDPQFSEWLCKRTPAARWGKVEELMGAGVFLASNASSFVNGHILYVDGGITRVL